MTYSQDILKAHSKWVKAEDKIPEHEWEPKYKERQYAAKTKYRLFADLCNKEGLKPVEVAHNIAGISTMPISLKK